MMRERLLAAQVKSLSIMRVCTAAGKLSHFLVLTGMPAILDISIYLFLNAMTTVSAMIFLYSSTTKVASVAAIHMDEMGEVASAAAMAMLIVYACITVRLLHLLATRGLLRRLQAWRTRDT